MEVEWNNSSNLPSLQPRIESRCRHVQGSGYLPKVGGFPDWFSGFRHHVSPQNANIHVFKNASKFFELSVQSKLNE